MVAKVHQMVASEVESELAQVYSGKPAQGTLGESAITSVELGNLIYTEVLEDDTKDYIWEIPDQESGNGLSHTPKLVTKEHIVNKTVEMLGDVAEDIDQGDPEQESSSRDLGHIVMLAAEDHTVGDITVKTAELQEIAVQIDAARDWEADFEEFADMRDSTDDLCVMKEIPEASRSYQKVWYCKVKKKTANLLRSLLQ